MYHQLAIRLFIQLVTVFAFFVQIIVLSINHLYQHETNDSCCFCTECYSFLLHDLYQIITIPVSLRIFLILFPHISKILEGERREGGVFIVFGLTVEQENTRMGTWPQHCKQEVWRYASHNLF